MINLLLIGEDITLIPSASQRLNIPDTCIGIIAHVRLDSAGQAEYGVDFAGRVRQWSQR